MLFDGFLSYSHSNVDQAEALHRELERFARPWYRPRGVHVFIDKANLAAAPVLREEIASALSAARFLILLASRVSAKSAWVDLEVRWWLDHRSADSIILVRIDGVIRWDKVTGDFDWQVTDALPAALKGQFKGESLYADLADTQGLPVQAPAFRHAVAQVVARLRGVPLDAILGEHLLRRRQARLTVAAVAVLVVGLGVGSVVLDRRARIEKVAKEGQRALSLSREYAAKSHFALAHHDARGAVLWGLVAVHKAETTEARGALLEALVATQHFVAELPVAAEAPIDAVALVVSRGWLIAGDRQGVLSIWDFRQGQCLARFERVSPGAITSISVSADGQLALVGSDEGAWSLWDLNRRARIQVLDAQAAFALAFQRTGSSWVSADRVGTLSQWTLGPNGASMVRRAPSSDSVVSVAVTTDNRIVTGSVIGVVRLHDANTLRPLRDIDPEPSTGAVVDVSADGRWLLLAGGMFVRRVDLRDLSPEAAPDARQLEATVDAARFVRPSGGEVALATQQELHLWGDTPRVIGFHATSIMSLAADPQSGLLVTGDGRGRVRVWAFQPNNGFVRIVRTPADDMGFQVAALDPDGRSLAIAASDAHFDLTRGRWVSKRANILIADTTTGVVKRTLLDVHRGYVNALALSPGAKWLASAGDDGCVTLWDASQGNSRAIDCTPSSPATAVSFDADGRWLAYVHSDGLAAVWDIAQEKIIWQANPPDVRSIAFGGSEGKMYVVRVDGRLELRDVVKGTSQGIYSPPPPKRQRRLAPLPQP
ncbi:toll/interleukin-1 receptor domain-containing protein [Sphaerotilus microaerophilus]|uniref:toll/interleukin-1 receptor domain-containing protein n=1 Tax=Sphaerotilus microaerophilus TaxID=2914710 RepID=UPI00207341A4|nr:TIR domain-containing protein [Sphaerotilus sp. FB-5]